MGCACINKIFDLSVTAMDPTRMLVKDNSVWMDDSGFDTHEVTFDIHITSLTARGIDTTIPLAIGGSMILTAKELYGGKSGDCIKDGFYCFSVGPEGVGACGEYMAINRVWLPNAMCALDALRANGKDDIDKQIEMDVWRLINKIDSQVRLNWIEEAKDLYKILSDKLKGLNCDCCK